MGELSTHPQSRGKVSWNRFVGFRWGGAFGSSPLRYSPLADLAKQGDVTRMAAAIQQGADVRQAEPDGMQPLHWAAEYDQTEAVRVLLEAGAEATARTRYGVSRRCRWPPATAMLP